MSRFRDVADAIRGSLEREVAGAGPADPRGRVAATLIEALERAATLDIPLRARKRLEEARDRIGAGPIDAEALAWLRQHVSALLDEDYPLKVLRQPTERVTGVGPKSAAALIRREVHSVEDLLLFLPRSYEDRRDRAAIEDLQVGRSVCFEGRVVRSGVIPLRKGRQFLLVVVTDGTAAVNLKWFRGIAHFQDRLKPGVRLLVAGNVRRYRYAKELHHPDVEVLGEDTGIASVARIVPSYPAVEGVPPRTLRRIVESAVAHAADLLEDHLPEQAALDLGLPALGDSVRQVHEPALHLDPDQLDRRATPHHLRLVAEELFLLQAGLALRRSKRAEETTLPLIVEDPVIDRAIASLDFELTSDQACAWSEIRADLARPHPMSRLLIGDVGTGKTVLALLSGVVAHACGGLTAVLAPTEILAEQHLRTFRAFAVPLGLRVALLTGSTSAADRRSIQRLLRLGEIDFVVGTHALLADSLDLPRLRMVVIDEQHRFGVEQRQGLGRKGERPHVLIMSATPIPRTLALTVYGDLEQSVLRERPPGRDPVRTFVVPPGSGRRVLSEVQRTLARGEQVYVVYPLVEESESQDLLDATRAHARLCALLPDQRVTLLHGRMSSAERADVMAGFASGDVQVLVSTTVIEVGLDVANATLLVVQHAERFGLAQLHQLRGRVGRGGRPGKAILIADPAGEDASSRLAILESSASGFDIADEDLRIRGAGEWLGTRQAGRLPELRLADLVRHAELLEAVRRVARQLLAHDPDLRLHPRLRAAVERRWGRRLDLGGVA